MDLIVEKQDGARVGPGGGRGGDGVGGSLQLYLSGSSSLMKFWSPDTRLARAPVDPERSLRSLLLVKSYGTEHPGSQRVHLQGSSGESIGQRRE